MTHTEETQMKEELRIKAKTRQEMNAAVDSGEGRGYQLKTLSFYGHVFDVVMERLFKDEYVNEEKAKAPLPE